MRPEGQNRICGAVSELWTRLAPQVLGRIVAVMGTALSEARFDFKAQGWGVRLLTLVEKARRTAPD